MFQFAHQERLGLLLILAVLGLVAMLTRRGRKVDWLRLGQPGRPESTGVVQWILAALCLVVALAQPRWGRSNATRESNGHDVVVAIDLSRSMGAQDAVPNRLGLASETAKSLIGALGLEPNARVAVVGFAGRGVLRCPLTEDLGAAADSVQALRVGEIEPNGTNLGAALDASLEAFDNQYGGEGQSIILFTDGEDHAQTWRGRIETLRSRGVIVHAIAIGDSSEGQTLPGLIDKNGRADSAFFQYQGQTVLSKRDDSALEVITASTGGALIRLGIASVDLGSLYRTRIEPTANANRLLSKSAELTERFEWFLLMAFSFTIAASWTGWRRLVQGKGSFAWSIVILTSIGGSVAPPPSVREAVEKGRSQYSEGHYQEALKTFQEARKSNPGNATLLFNEAASLFQLKQYELALQRYGEARERAAPRLKTKIDYALGNTSLALQDLAGAIRHYDACLTSKTQGNELDRVRHDALLNKTYVEEHSSKSPSLAESDAKTESPPASEPSSKNQVKEQNSASQDDRTEESSRNGSREPKRSRSSGGQGGMGEDPRPTTLEEQLERAIENVRQARKRRIEEALPPSSASDHKDW